MGFFNWRFNYKSREMRIHKNISAFKGKVRSKLKNLKKEHIELKKKLEKQTSSSQRSFNMARDTARTMQKTIDGHLNQIATMERNQGIQQNKLNQSKEDNKSLTITIEDLENKKRILQQELTNLKNTVEYEYKLNQRR